MFQAINWTGMCLQHPAWTEKRPSTLPVLALKNYGLARSKTGAHHHGPLESVIYVIKGRARMRWGDKLEFTAEAGPGDFIYVPPYVPHQEINASATEVLECVLCRSDGQAVAVNLDIEPVEKPEHVLWVDPTHPQGGV